MGLVPFPSVELKPAPVGIECRDIEHFVAFHCHSQNILVLRIHNIHLFQVKVRVVLVLKPETVFSWNVWNADHLIVMMSLLTAVSKSLLAE